MRIELHPDAEADLVDGFAFYDAQQAGLGDYFVDSLLADLESLQIYAGIHPIHFGFNRLLAKRFPFAVYYRVESDVVRVYAVLDCRRDPVVTQQRLG